MSSFILAIILIVKPATGSSLYAEIYCSYAEIYCWCYSPTCHQTFQLVDTTWKATYRMEVFQCCVHPKKHDTKHPDEFWPISLLPILSKVLERHFHCLVTSHITEHSPLSNCQWSFLPGRSTISGLITTTHHWLQLLEGGKEIGAVYFDFHCWPSWTTNLVLILR